MMDVVGRVDGMCDARPANYSNSNAAEQQQRGWRHRWGAAL
jgi:hypothetical protein